MIKNQFKNCIILELFCQVTADSNVLFSAVHLPPNGRGGLDSSDGLDDPLQACLEAVQVQQEQLYLQSPKEKKVCTAILVLVLGSNEKYSGWTATGG